MNLEVYYKAQTVEQRCQFDNDTPPSDPLYINIAKNIPQCLSCLTFFSFIRLSTFSLFSHNILFTPNIHIFKLTSSSHILFLLYSPFFPSTHTTDATEGEGWARRRGGLVAPGLGRANKGLHRHGTLATLLGSHT